MTSHMGLYALPSSSSMLDADRSKHNSLRSVLQAYLLCRCCSRQRCLQSCHCLGSCCYHPYGLLPGQPAASPLSVAGCNLVTLTSQTQTHQLLLPGLRAWDHASNACGDMSQGLALSQERRHQLCSP